MPARATSPAERVAAAFAPGHVTGLFSPDLRARDPRGRGSVGAGLVLELGVHATVRWRPVGRRPSVRVRADTRRPLPISADVARRLLGDRPGELEVTLRHELPIGQGFGMSASGALATGLAVAAALGSDRQHAIETAHLAELFGGGGLGGVAAILGGGMELRDRPGVPPYGHVRHAAFRPSILLAIVGPPLPSPPLLRSEEFLDRVRAAAGAGLPRIRLHPDGRTLMAEAEGFTDALGLASPSVRRRVAEIRATGASAAQLMFGNGVVAIAHSEPERRAVLRLLEREGARSVELNATVRGAHLVPGSAGSRRAPGSAPGANSSRSSVM